MITPPVPVRAFPDCDPYLCGESLRTSTSSTISTTGKTKYRRQLSLTNPHFNIESLFASPIREVFPASAPQCPAAPISLTNYCLLYISLLLSFIEP